MLEDWRRCLGETGDVGIEAMATGVVDKTIEYMGRSLVKDLTSSKMKDEE
jgi:hypothetical protein